MDIEPTLIERGCGGWLAMTPDGAALAFAVTGPDKETTRAAFEEAAARWVAASERASTAR